MQGLDGGGGAISPVPHHYWDPLFKASAKIWSVPKIDPFQVCDV
jgi:hypothetical protein